MPHPAELYVVYKTKMSRNLYDTAESALLVYSLDARSGTDEEPDLQTGPLRSEVSRAMPAFFAWWALRASTLLLLPQRFDFNFRLKSLLKLASNVCHPRTAHFFLNSAHLTLWASAIRFRAAVDIVRFDRVPLVVLPVPPRFRPSIAVRWRFRELLNCCLRLLPQRSRRASAARAMAYLLSTRRSNVGFISHLHSVTRSIIPNLILSLRVRVVMVH